MFNKPILVYHLSYSEIYKKKYIKIYICVLIYYYLFFPHRDKRCSKMTLLNNLPILTRKEANERGHFRYYTGRMCKHGHVGMRYTKTGICCECATSRAKATYASAVKPEVQNLRGIVVIELRSSTRNKILLDDFAFNVSKARWPQVDRVDICPMMAGYNGCGNGTYLYRYHVHCEDAELIENYAKTLLSHRGI